MPDVRPAHPDDFTLLRYLAGDLPSAEREAVEAHLAACQPCGTTKGELAQLDAALRELAREGSFPVVQEAAQLPPGDLFRERPPPAQPVRRRAIGVQTIAAAEEAATLQESVLGAAEDARQLAATLSRLSLGAVAHRFAILYALEESAKHIAESPTRAAALADAVLVRLRAWSPADESPEAEEAVPRPRLEAQAHLLTGQAGNWTKEFDRARQHLEHAYRLLGQTGDDEAIVAMVELAESQRRSFVGRGHEALVLARRATATFHALGLEDYTARGVVGQGLALATLGDREEAVHRYRSALPAFERAQLWSNYVGAVNSIGVALMNLGRLPEARREYARALRRLSHTEHRAWVGYVRHGLAEVLFAAGRYRQAAASLGQAVRLYRASGLAASALIATLFEIESWARSGDLDRARQRLERFEHEVVAAGNLDPALARQIAAALAGQRPDLTKLGELRAQIEPILRDQVGSLLA